MKYYPCLVISKAELEDNDIETGGFVNGHLKNRNAVMQIEDYIKLPVVSVRETTPNDSEVLVLAADGYVQYNPLSQKRTVVLTGDYEPLKTVLEDIYAERSDEEPYEVFCSYSYQATIGVQNKLQHWTRNEYQRA